MKNLINFLWTGFGTGVTAARALGIAILVLLIGVIAVYYIIAWIVRLVRKDSATPQQP